MAKKVNLDKDFVESAEEVVVVQDSPENIVREEVVLPPKFTPERTEFILSHLETKESFEGNPKVSGLVRLVEKFIGEIVGTDLSYPSLDLEHNAAAAIVSLSVETPRGKLLRYSAGADSTRYNNDNPKFVIFPTACAATKAMGRAAIQALGIVATSSEEMCYNAPLVNVSEQFGEAKISDGQLTAIEVICKTANINTNALLRLYAKQFGRESISGMSKAEGLEVIKSIQVYQQGAEVPQGLLGFQQLKRK